MEHIRKRFMALLLCFILAIAALVSSPTIVSAYAGIEPAAAAFGFGRQTIVSGQHHGIIVIKNGSLWYYPNISVGDFATGGGNWAWSDTPIRISNFTDIIEVKLDGGAGALEPLGVTPPQFNFLRSNGNLYALRSWDSNVSDYSIIATDVIGFTAGGNRVIRSDNTLYTIWGGVFMDDVVDVTEPGMILRANGEVWFGGSLVMSNIVQIQASSRGLNHHYMLDRDGNVWAHTSSVSSIPSLVATGATEINAGSNGVLIRKTNGVLYFYHRSFVLSGGLSGSWIWIYQGTLSMPLNVGTDIAQFVIDRTMWGVLQRYDGSIDVFLPNTLLNIVNAPPTGVPVSLTRIGISPTASGGLNTPLPPGDIRDADMGENIVRVNGQIQEPQNGGLDLIAIRMPFLANWAAVPLTSNADILNDDSFWGFDIIGSAVHTISTTTPDVSLSVHVVGFYENADTNPWVNDGIAQLRIGTPTFNSAGSRVLPDTPVVSVLPLISNGEAAKSFPNAITGAPTPQLLSTNLHQGEVWAPGHIRYVFTGSLERTAPFPGGVSHFEDITGNAAPNDVFTLDTSHNLTFRFALVP